MEILIIIYLVGISQVLAALQTFPVCLSSRAHGLPSQSPLHVRNLDIETQISVPVGLSKVTHRSLNSPIKRGKLPVKAIGHAHGATNKPPPSKQTPIKENENPSPPLLLPGVILTVTDA